MTTSSDLRAVVARFAGRRVAVVGDVMLDHFVFGQVDRISPEAPVPVVRFGRDDFRLGGAANVAQNLAALGAHVSVVGLVGSDDAATTLRTRLGEAGLDAAGVVVDPSRPTTRKVRVVTSRNQQVARIDYESDADASDAIAQQLAGAVAAAAARAEALVISDYRKGVVSPTVIVAAVAAAKKAAIPLLVDPKVPQAERYRGASVITPNHHEAEVMTQIAIRSADDAQRAARELHERSGASVLITWGEHGMWIHDASSSPAVEEHWPAVTREVADVTGAGDTVIATLAVAMAAGAPLAEAARLANIAAGLAVARFGPATITAAELAAALG